MHKLISQYVPFKTSCLSHVGHMVTLCAHWDWYKDMPALHGLPDTADGGTTEALSKPNKNLRSFITSDAIFHNMSRVQPLTVVVLAWVMPPWDEIIPEVPVWTASLITVIWLMLIVLSDSFNVVVTVIMSHLLIIVYSNSSHAKCPGAYFFSHT